MNQEARVSCLPCQATTTVTTTVSSSAVIVIAPKAPRVHQEPVVENGVIMVQPKAIPQAASTPGAESQVTPTVAEKVQVLRDLKAIGMLSQNKMIEAIYGATENEPNDFVEHPQIVQDQPTKEEPPVVGIHGEASENASGRGGWALIRAFLCHHPSQ